MKNTHKNTEPSSKKTLTKAGLLAAALSTLTACDSLPNVPQGSMLLDTQRQVLCYHSAAECYSLDLIITNTRRDRVLSLYNMNPWDWTQLRDTKDLSNLLTTAIDSKDTFKQLSDTQYLLPINDRTYEAWRILKLEHLDRYECPAGPYCD